LARQCNYRYGAGQEAVAKIFSLRTGSGALGAQYVVILHGFCVQSVMLAGDRRLKNFLAVFRRHPPTVGLSG
jgi:hypothetical protein